MISFAVLLSNGQTCHVGAFSQDEAWENVERKLFDRGDFETAIVQVFQPFSEYRAIAQRKSNLIAHFNAEITIGAWEN